MSFSYKFSDEQIWMSGFLMIIPLISNYKQPDGVWFKIDLNLARDNPPASIKYMDVGNQNQLNLISITVYFSYFRSLLLLQLM